ncbi:hypothetical protein M4I32_06415 [Microbacterium sp. LRZ72]|uniref:hypothetical protein n=1 Tax=Microbacterium sp. LRZ72 TaxID=2942481 RepID=UPI0029A12E6A|nr:hypothetical protein [Microbacterium sp. LRZ72]MDX2376430.1 hypothetical protein [Microbacterium sp. LRZ72]
MTDPGKRPAFESPIGLVSPVGHDPQMARPAATKAGAALVALRALAGIAWLIALAASWPEIVGELDEDGIELDAESTQIALILIIIGYGLVIVVDAAFAVLIYLGFNWPRVIVMLVSTFSITIGFTQWWLGGQEIHLTTTLLTLGLDILLLLALSSRSAAAYARRNQRR